MTSRRRRAVRRAVPLVVLAAAVVTAAALAGQPADHPPLDPAGTGPRGTKALLDVLDELGVDVRVTDEADAGDAVALLLADTLDEERSDALRRWVQDGGRLVVADPNSPFAPDVAGPAGIGPLETSLARRCDVPALADVDRVVAPGGVVYAGAADRTRRCFPRSEGHWLVAEPEQEGVVVAVGGPGAFTNAALGEADNGLLAAALLGSGGPVVILRPGTPGEGEAGLLDLVTAPVWLALAQLGLAFVVIVAWRARRLGAPVTEPQPVQLAGSELVTAVGNLLHQTRNRGAAARLLRDETRRELAERLGLPADAGPSAVAEAVVRRTGGDPGDLVALLDGDDPASEDELVALAADLERGRDAALAPPTTNAPAPPTSNAPAPPTSNAPAPPTSNAPAPPTREDPRVR